MTPLLSVLIPSVPSRREQAWALFDKISAQAEGLPVEVLLLLDNKTRTVGKKREALVQASRGDYVAFVDDDDDVTDHYIRAILSRVHYRAGVITFDTLVTLNGGPDVICEHRLLNPNEEYNPAGFRRAPWQMHAWRGSIARRTPFWDINNGEDWLWCKAMLEHVNIGDHIDAVLYHYRYNDATTEASKS